MIWLIFGLIVWADVHISKRLLPDVRSALIHKMGGGAYRGLVSLLLVLSIVLMVIGFRQMGSAALYDPPSWLMPIAAILLFFAVVLMGLSKSQSTYRGALRHPMLAGIILWGIGHLMISGEGRAIILFGGMILWAIAEIKLINSHEPNYTPPEAGTRKGDIRLLVISTILYLVIIGIHIWLIRGF